MRSNYRRHNLDTYPVIDELGYPPRSLTSNGLTKRDCVLRDYSPVNVRAPVKKIGNYQPSLSVEGEYQVWAGPLTSGNSRYVVLALNEGDEPTTITIPLHELPGLKSSSDAKHLRVTDVWAKKDLRCSGTKISLEDVKSSQTKVLLFSIALGLCRT